MLVALFGIGCIRAPLSYTMSIENASNETVRLSASGLGAAAVEGTLGPGSEVTLVNVGTRATLEAEGYYLGEFEADPWSLRVRVRRDGEILVAERIDPRPVR